MTSNIAFEFEKITSYLRDYSGEKYEKPQKSGNRKDKMIKFKESGKKARDEFIKYANYIAETLNYKAGNCSGWKNQAQIACTYFWIELKKIEAIEFPHSISISINKYPEHDINGPITLSFRVEAKDNVCSDLDYKIHNKIVDVQIKEDSKIYYQANLLDGTCRCFDNNMVELEKIKKLKVVKNIIGPYEKNNTPKIIEDSIEAAKELVPFYEHILKERELSLSKNVEEEMKEIKPELNTILYGPPGTGKTYNTVNYAVAICENKNIEDVQSEEYEKVLHRYNELKKEGRIAFTTFHQSYGYEEFIEGISPIIVEDNNDDSSGNIEYKIKSGIFKSFCEEIEKITINNDKFFINKDATIWKVTVGSKVQNDCFVNNYIRIGFGIHDEGAKEFVNQINEGDIIITTDGNRKNIRGIAIATSDEAYKLENTESDSTTRDVMWLVRDINDDVTILNGNKWLQRKTVSRLPNMNIKDLMEFAIKKNVELKETHIEKNNGSYVFIIDEINRGNISKIFGELITLIEDTKRKGMIEEMSTILPYSGNLFSVPSNVYILGTMNTADRSIALMDTALRRRFQFVEMMPDTDILKNVTVEGVEIAPILKKINERITFLYDREHTIGHAFFIKLIGSPNINTLGSIFEKSIIPLLQEYFYEDYQKIQLVLGDNGKVDASTKFIKDEEVKVKNIFKENKENAVDVVDLPEKKYTINKEAFLNIESYKQIL